MLGLPRFYLPFALTTKYKEAEELRRAKHGEGLPAIQVGARYRVNASLKVDVGGRGPIAKTKSSVRAVCSSTAWTPDVSVGRTFEVVGL